MSTTTVDGCLKGQIQDERCSCALRNPLALLKSGSRASTGSGGRRSCVRERPVCRRVTGLPMEEGACA
jgi:hypothetical protein